MTLNIPRDRNVDFEPKVIRNWTQILAHLSIYFEERILTLS
ncbi:hypothetical protein [Clostridioides sp. ES-S-0190-01]